ncbi:MAG: NAD-dependent epimerase/dehydratase family protein [Thermodesulfobacteriota bacterium]|nr:NAD-dependent epimerase/dehydratase family protein [Thermodesulfobacteriota bacterium]
MILGAGGFMGRSITTALAATEADLTLLDTRFTEEQRDTFRCVEGDFSSSADLEPVLRGSVDTVVHLISSTVPVTGDKYPAADVMGNLVNTIEMLDLCVRQNVRRVIFASSGGTIYGPLDRPANEDDPCCPGCSYAIVKRAIEEYLSLYHRLKGLEYLILRVGNPYGAAQTGKKPQGVIGAFLHRILEGKRIEIWGDGSVVRDFIHIDDVALAFVAASQYSGSERIFNVGTGQGHSINEVVELIESTVGRSVTRSYCPQNSLDIPTNVLDISRIRRETGWEPTISLDEGISRVYREISDDVSKRVLQDCR